MTHVAPANRRRGGNSSPPTVRPTAPAGQLPEGAPAAAGQRAPSRPARRRAELCPDRPEREPGAARIGDDAERGVAIGERALAVGAGGDVRRGGLDGGE